MREIQVPTLVAVGSLITAASLFSFWTGTVICRKDSQTQALIQQERPSYKAGKCYAWIEEDKEAWEQAYKAIARVEQVGKRKYAYSFCFHTCTETISSNRLNSREFESFEEQFAEPVECPPLGNGL